MLQRNRLVRTLAGALLPASLVAPCARAGDTPAAETWNLHAQSTYVWQAKPAFEAGYSGPFSLQPQRETGYSFSATAAFGVRAWEGGELYVDPEVVQGKTLSGLHGLGGMTNGEQQKTSGANPTLYRARLFLRQTWNLEDGERQSVASDMNQLAGSVSSRRLVLTAGNLAASDIFDVNGLAHDARSQFLNWALVANGAWDFAADARGYSWGAALEYIDGGWAVRAGRFLQPAEPNGLPLDRRIFVHHGDQLEVERATDWAGAPGKVRLLAFRNRVRSGGFEDALQDAARTGQAPDVARVRRDRGKTGFGINLEQAVAGGVGLFARASRNDGQSETYAFAEIDRSVSGGVTLAGARWGRTQDAAGIALVANGLSGAHRAYLAAGGLGGFLGDGRLDYRAETIMEGYYRFDLGHGLQVSLDGQRIANPGYNHARGPVHVASVRLHTQY